MSFNRHENSTPSSLIRAVITYFGDDCGLIGPRFALQGQNYEMHEMPEDQLADFLNDATGRNGSEKTISDSVEAAIVKDFSNVLRLTGDGSKYEYIGPRCTNAYEYFSGSSYNASCRQYSEQEDLLQSANRNEQAHQVGSFSKNEAQAVLQHEVAITNSNSTKPILGTYGAGPCVIVALYNPQTKVAALAHVDSLTNINSLAHHVDQISSVGAVEVHLSGGDSSSKKMVTEIIKLINSRQGAKIISANVCNGYESKSLALDSRTGAVFTSFDPKQLQHADDWELRLQLVGMQFSSSAITKSFDGREVPRPMSTVSYTEEQDEERKNQVVIQPRFYAPPIFFAFNWLMYLYANQRTQAHNNIQPQAMMWLQNNAAFKRYFYNRRIPDVIGFFNKKLPDFNPRKMINIIFRR